MEKPGSPKNQDKPEIKLPKPNQIEGLAEELLEEKSGGEIYEEAVIDNVKMKITVPEFKRYLEDSESPVAISKSLSSLYHADPQPVLPKHFFRNQFRTICNAPSDPLMELIEARYKIEKLEKENLK